VVGTDSGSFPLEEFCISGVNPPRFLPTVVRYYKENPTVLFQHYTIINFLYLSGNEKCEIL
jgi:hypothetical protein